MSPTGDLLVTLIFRGAVSSRACSEACACCTGTALCRGQHTLWGNKHPQRQGSEEGGEVAAAKEAELLEKKRSVWGGTAEQRQRKPGRHEGGRGAEGGASQRSLHNAPIFRLLLKVAVNGTHQCDFLNFCGPFGVQQIISVSRSCDRHGCGSLQWRAVTH